MLRAARLHLFAACHTPFGCGRIMYVFAESGDRKLNLQNQQAPFQTARVSNEVLINLYSNEDKPATITPLDIAVISYLVLRKAFDHEIYDSQSTLAMRLATDYKAVKRSLARLDTLGWITYRGRGIGKPKGISLNLEKLPAAQPIREKITPDASLLVDFYIELKKSIANKQN